jgi:hypothetical protein
VPYWLTKICKDTSFHQPRLELRVLNRKSLRSGTTPLKVQNMDAKNDRDLLTLQIPCEYDDIFAITVTRREKFVSRRELEAIS